MNRKNDRVNRDYGFPSPVKLIAITGGSGSGKTWLARRLQRRLGRRAGLLSLDDFYRDLSGLPPARRDRVNFDHPAAIDWPLFLRCLDEIRRGEPARLPRYDFATHTRHARPRRWRPRPVVLIDGLWLLHRPELRRLYALTLYLDCPEELRLARRLARDQAARGRSRASVLRQWRRQVRPMHQRHVAPQKKHAGLAVTPETLPAGLSGLARRILTLPPKRSAGPATAGPALDVQTLSMVDINGTLVRRTYGYKPVRDRRSGGSARRAEN
jgi:uridine kinase